MNPNIISKEDCITFQKWTRKSYSVFASLKRKIKIGFLIVCYVLVLKPSHLFGQSYDTVATNNIDLEEVSVMGKRTPDIFRSTSRKITVLQKEDILRLPVNSVDDLLDYLPGVDIRERSPNGVQSDIQIRGGSFDQVMVLLNGMNISDPQTGHFNLNLPIELSNIERIEVLHGAGARIHGANAYKGVINIVTQKTGNKLAGGYTWGQHKLRHRHIIGGLDNQTFYNRLQAGFNESDGFSQNTDYNLSNLFYQGGFRKNQFSADVQFGFSNKQYGANNFYSPRFPEQYEETNTRFLSADINYNKAKSQFNLKTYYRNHLDHFLLFRYDPERYENYHKTTVYGGEAGYSFSTRAGVTHTGLQFRQETIFSNLLGNPMAFPERVKGTDSVYYTASYQRNNLSLFFEHGFSFRRINMSGGVMTNYNEDYDNNLAFFPGFDLGFTLSDHIRLYSSVNRSLRLPNFTDMFYTDPSNEGSSILKPEQMTSFEAGTKYKNQQNNMGFSLDITAFLDKGEKVIDWIYLTERELYKAMNIGELITYGIGVVTEIQFTTPLFYLLNLKRLHLAYSFTDIDKNQPGLQSKYSLNHLKHKVSLQSMHKITPKIQLGWNLNYFDRNGTYQDYDAENASIRLKTFKPYFLFDTRLAYSRRFISFFLDIHNIFDANYTDVTNLMQPGRWVTGGFSFDFSRKNKR